MLKALKKFFGLNGLAPKAPHKSAEGPEQNLVQYCDDGWVGPGGGGLAQGLGIKLFAFGGAYWPLATAHSDPLWARTCFGCVNGAPG